MSGAVTVPSTDVESLPTVGVEVLLLPSGRSVRVEAVADTGAVGGLAVAPEDSGRLGCRRRG